MTNIRIKKARLMLDRLYEQERENMRRCPTERMKEKFQLQDKQDKKDQAIIKEWSKKDAQEYMDQCEKERKEATELESQSLLKSARNWK